MAIIMAAAGPLRPDVRRAAEKGSPVSPGELTAGGRKSFGN
jgi:hypothetical protein